MQSGGKEPEQPVIWKLHLNSQHWQKLKRGIYHPRQNAVSSLAMETMLGFFHFWKMKLINDGESGKFS